MRARTLTKGSRAVERGVSSYTRFAFQYPFRNNTTLATVMIVNAIGIAMKTPVGPRPSGLESTQASGISQHQNEKKFSHVGVRVSPAPLKAEVTVMPIA